MSTHLIPTTRPDCVAASGDMVTCNGCGCECTRESADVIHDYAQYLLFTQDYSAEYNDWYCPSCITWINDEYQVTDAADDAYDAWTDRRAGYAAHRQVKAAPTGDYMDAFYKASDADDGLAQLRRDIWSLL